MHVDAPNAGPHTSPQGLDTVQVARFKPPPHIGPYEVLGPIGRGGMGVVFRGRHAVSGELVAIKTVEAPHAGRMAAIRREIHCLRRLSHPGVVRVRDSGVVDGRPWYAMELLVGVTLRDLVDEHGAALGLGQETESMPAEDLARAQDRAGRGGSLPPAIPGAVKVDRVLSLIHGLCEPLEYLHGEGLVHRDLKPENVFLRDGHRPTLVDFGLVSYFSSASGRDRIDVVDMLGGSVNYMSPELISGQVVDARADAYALGCILFELLTGVPPFFGGTRRDILDRHLSVPPPPPSQLRADVTPALDALVAGLLQKRPRDRIGHLSDVARALEALGVASADQSRLRHRAYFYRPDFVGRDAAFDDTWRFVDGAVRGQGGVLVVAGESGIGKTRLVTEVAEHAQRDGVIVTAGACVRALGQGAAELPGVSGSPLHALRPLMHRIADFATQAGALEAERILGDRSRLLAFIDGSMVNPQGIDAGDAAHGLPLSTADQVLAALAETLRAFAEAQGLLVVIDDLQWADQLTRSLLARVASGALAVGRTAFLVTRRTEGPGETPGSATERWEPLPVAELRLAPVGDTASLGIANDLLGVDVLPAEFAARLVRVAAGRPFLVSEYLLAAIDRDDLVRSEDGRWHLLAGNSTDPMPESLQGVVADRLARLPAEARLVIDVASVTGGPIDLDLVARTGAIDEDDLLTGAVELLRRRILVSDNDGVTRFSHGQVREVAYRALEPARKQAMHDKAARALVGMSADGGREVDSHAVAQHFLQAGHEDLAFPYLVDTALASARAGAFRDARDLFRVVFELDARASGTLLATHTPAALAELECAHADALWGTGDIPAAQHWYVRALSRLGVAIPHASRRWGWFNTKALTRQLAQLTAGLFRRGAPTSRSATDPNASLAAVAATRLQYTYTLTNDAGGVFGLTLTVLNQADRSPPSTKIAPAYATGYTLASFAKLRKLARSYRARAMALAGSDEHALLQIRLSDAYVANVHADWDALDVATNEGLQLTEACRDRYTNELFRVLRGVARLYRGQAREAQEDFEIALASARHHDHRAHEGFAAMMRDLMAYRQGRYDDAERGSDELCQLVSETTASKDVMTLANGVAILAGAALGRGDLERALREVDRALELRQDAPPSSPAAYVALLGPVEVIAAAGSTDAFQTGEARASLVRRAQVLARQFRRYAAIFPVGRAAASLADAVRARLEGNRRRAEVALDRAEAQSRQDRLVWEAALVTLERGRLALDATESARHATLAAESLRPFGFVLPVNG